ncbi:metallophosphoesterase family protein [Sphingomonas jatrophae]|uniref:3',5'-cyclic AMP phosphodiesterase CpdA n=1 Tax=Sphingomonas jatrophae TaxID=1166337 RepID=A0A1I6L1X3_9SPHN|nr:metallophosphoesterase [Sphingomonas jatrophae]SFR97446.1 3',5'-cyclic AMP phosphodiesterase CpdA [Sphingomonas jatrophae]
MIRLFHVSDIHFGAEDREALDWFARQTRAERPDAVIVTGDLTMRARSREFAAAGEWLRTLERPVTVEVGNHDLPYFNPLARFAAPYRRYEAVERAIETPLEIEGVAVVPLRTTARFQWRLNWSKGRVSGGALARSLKLVGAVPAGDMVLVAAHHPLIEAGTKSSAHTHGGVEALAALARAGVAAVLTGHVHDPFDIAHPVEGRTIRLIGAGTLSERVRRSPPSFNEIRIAHGRIDTIVRLLGERDRPLHPRPLGGAAGKG